MLEFVIGCMVGGIIGTAVICLCVAAGQADRNAGRSNAPSLPMRQERGFSTCKNHVSELTWFL